MSTSHALATALAAVLLASVHVLSPRLGRLDRTPRSVWLSAAGGVSVAYVFVHLLPEIARAQAEALGPRLEGPGGLAQGLAGTLAETGLFLLALGGFVAFYGLERFAKRRGGGRRGDTPAGAFWLHLGSFALYNAVIAYLLREQVAEGGAGGLAVYAGALALHGLTTDRALYEHHGRRYRAVGRWVLVGAIALGWALGLALRLPAIYPASALALLGGSVVLNVVKEEVPAERESRFGAFLIGAVAYAALLLLA